MTGTQRDAADNHFAGRDLRRRCRNQKMLRRRRIVLTVCIFWCCFGVGIFIGRALGKVASRTVSDTDYGTAFAREDGADVSGQHTKKPGGRDTQPQEPEEEELREKARQIYTANAGIMMLVNREREFDEAGALKLRSICQGRLQAADVLYDDLCAMLAASSEEGYGFWIASAYRSRQRQQQLIDEDVAKLRRQGMSQAEALREVYRETMPAGCSEHETGLALDILASSDPNMSRGQEDTPENRWLQQHCHEYGFIIRYPEGKAEVTGIRYEPWHLRYVGREAAAFLWEHDLTLEEFYQLLE